MEDEGTRRYSLHRVNVMETIIHILLKRQVRIVSMEKLVYTFDFFFLGFLFFFYSFLPTLLFLVVQLL